MMRPHGFSPWRNTEAGPSAENSLIWPVTSSQTVGEGSPIFRWPLHGLIGIGCPNLAGKNFVVAS
jgi:hypothetical protein